MRSVVFDAGVAPRSSGMCTADPTSSPTRFDCGMSLASGWGARLGRSSKQTRNGGRL
jgi:hypothetical protein